MLMWIESMRRRFLISSLGALICGISLPGLLQRGAFGLSNEDTKQHTGMPIHFKAEKPGFVTLVVEDTDGNRLKNLVFDYPVNAGDNLVYWDGSSVTGTANPGTYVVRGIFHEGITPHLEYSIYSPIHPPWPTVDGTSAWFADHTAPASALFLPEGSPCPVKDPKPVVLPAAVWAEAGNFVMCATI